MLLALFSLQCLAQKYGTPSVYELIDGFELTLCRHPGQVFMLAAALGDETLAQQAIRHFSHDLKDPSLVFDECPKNIFTELPAQALINLAFLCRVRGSNPWTRQAASFSLLVRPNLFPSGSDATCDLGT
jgi:hypothetical protein